MIEKLRAALVWLAALCVIGWGIGIALVLTVVSLLAALSPILIPFLIVVWLLKCIVT